MQINQPNFIRVLDNFCATFDYVIWPFISKYMQTLDSGHTALQDAIISKIKLHIGADQQEIENEDLFDENNVHQDDFEYNVEHAMALLEVVGHCVQA